MYEQYRIFLLPKNKSDQGWSLKDENFMGIQPFVETWGYKTFDNSTGIDINGKT